jgi:hypothetical protein
MKIDEWRLANDAGVDLGIVQAFEADGPFYGNTAYGRTGPMRDRLRCQAEVERMLETGCSRRARQ